MHAKLSVISLILSFFLLAGIWGCDQGQEERQVEDQSAALEAEEAAAYLEAGKRIVKTSFETLSGHLKAALQAEGVPGALDYCHTAAYPLTDSLSRAMAVSIRRTSLKPRNAANTPDSLEREMLNQLAAMASPQPQVVATGEGRYSYFHPIMVQEACLACHGKPGESLSLAHQALIQQRYPADQATGYTEGDFRGMWRVDFVEGQNPQLE